MVNTNDYFKENPQNLEQELINDADIDKHVEDVVKDAEYEKGFAYGIAKASIRQKANKVPNEAIWQQWLGLPDWKPEQAICLLFDTIPSDYEFIKNIQYVQMLMEYAVRKGNMTPYQWQQFGVEQKLLPPNWIMLIKKPMSVMQVEAVEDVGKNSSTPDNRQSQLYIFIWRVQQALLSSRQKRPTAQLVWNEIQYHHEKHDTDKIIQEVHGEQILWCSGYGNEQKLKRTTFNSTLSKLRKLPPTI
jgi:hypothetical protein